MTGLIAWAGYLVSGWVPVAWASAVVLLPVLGLGIATLLAAIPDVAPAAKTPMPVLLITAHGIFATATMLLVLLAALAAR